MKQTTIVIPSYNQQDYLPDALDSALSQTVPCDVIVVDDGSTDNSLEIAQRYEKEHPRLKVISQENKGLSEARNTGIRAATTEYVSFLDADDIYQDNYAEKVMEAAEVENRDVIAPSFKEFGMRNGTIILGAFSLPDLLAANRIGYFSTFKRDTLLEVGCYNPNMKWGYEDYELAINLMKRGKTFHILQDVLVLYRVKEHSMIDEAQAHHEELMAQIAKNHPELYA